MKLRMINIILILTLIMSAALVASARDGKEAADYAIVTASKDADAKIDSDLRSAIEASSAGKKIQFTARIMAGSDLGKYTNTWFARPFSDPLGSTVAVGYAKPSALLKIAADPNVISMWQAQSLTEAPVVEDPDTKIEVIPSVNLDPIASSGPAPEGWYHTTGAIHGSQVAWDKGYTGTGVRYMSNDSGADYCHPDLQGTWAYIDDDSSAYYGLPEMFDSFSSLQAAYDYYLGESRIADGLADWADTSATTTGPTFSYQPIGAAVVHTYTVPATSLSGVYHYGSHTDRALALNAAILSSEFGDGTAVSGERAAVLVVDENSADVYDTVYVDLNYNFDFSDDAPARLTRDFTYQETACLDYDLDGLNDVSGGLVFFISDGTTAVPTLDWFWGIPGSFFGNGDLVAFHVQDFTEAAGDHGMGTTSVAVGQGVVAGSVFWGPGGPPQAEGRGLVVGPGKDVMSTQNGNQYVSPFGEDAYIFAGLGYDGISGTGDDIQIVSNSFGSSDIDNDGFDYESRLFDSINRALAPNTALLFSTGNGAAGYGTVAPPSPASGIGIGASTLYGSIGLFESIASAEQIVGGDPMSWSNRGPGARGTTGADVVATGAFGTGDLSLNEVLWGAIATSNFGGTSMAAPVAAGNLALMYQAWYDRTGSWPTFQEAKELLMSTAMNTDHDVWTQGGGLVDADEGTDVAGGLGGVYATPADWAVGDYRGDEFEAFANVIAPGDSDVEEFTLINTGDRHLRVDLSSLYFKLINTRDYSFTSLDQSLDHGSFTTPDYAMRIDQEILNSTDMLMVRVTKPYEQFDPTGEFGPFNNWRVHLQDWTDLNGDGNFWDDLNGNGKVDIGEMDENEHIRFTYGYDMGPGQQARIANPLERMHDGILLTFRHRDRTELVPTTDLTVEASFWKWTNWPWLHIDKKKVTVPAGGTATFSVSIKIPPNTPYGMYEGEIVARGGDSEVIIPVNVVVAASGTSFTFGQTNYKDGQTPLYDNENLFGYTDYSWRAESGDWRFYWTDVAEGDLPEMGQSYLVVDNKWSNDGTETDPGTDIDTIVLGPTSDEFSVDDPSIYGPYTLEEVGRSAYMYVGSGRWLYQTSSGGPREIIAAPLQEGLYSIMLHQVRVDGNYLNDPFYGVVGLVNLDPGAVVASAPTGMGSMDVTIKSELEMGGFVAEGFGLGGPITTKETIHQDDPNDPSTASFTETVDIDHGAMLDVSTCCTTGSDIDLFLYGPDGGLIASSTTPADEEHVSVLFPEDGTYTVAVHGWSVPAGTDTFDLTINAVQGYDVSVSNLPSSIPAGGSADITVNWDTTGFDPGTYYGLVLMGPAEAPGLLQVPVEVTVEDVSLSSSTSGFSVLAEQVWRVYLKEGIMRRNSSQATRSGLSSVFLPLLTR